VRRFSPGMLRAETHANKRNPSLDVLRGIAIALVLLCHYPYARWMGAGWIGVDLFFVLSGFLISGLLFTEIKRDGSISIGRFLARRGFKIYPSFYVFIGLTALLIPALRRHFLVHALFLQSYYPADLTIWIHTWSLAVEEHFYLILPFLLALLARVKRLHWIPWIAALLVACCFILRIETDTPHMWASHLRMDALFAGVAIGYLFHFRSKQFAAISRWYLPLIAAPFLVAPFAGPESNYAMSATMTANLIGFSLVLIWAVPRHIPYCAWLATLGTYSYSIYIWHQAVARLWQPTKHMSFLGLWGYLATSLIVGLEAARLIEAPCLAIREKVFQPRKVSDPRRSKPGLRL
jgi:peptidoglycan/LPS O-acetylase OafA/YrhL